MTTSDFVPDWAKGIVWYQIFPERFWNGDPNNYPRLEDQAGAWPHDTNPPWQIHPWASDWYEMQPYERANGQSLWHNLQRRLNGGEELLVQGSALAVEISPQWGRILLAG